MLETKSIRLAERLDKGEGTRDESKMILRFIICATGGLTVLFTEKADMKEKSVGRG